MSSALTGRGGIVTGAGSGIGRAVTLHLASLGASVLAVDIHEEAAREVCAAANGLPGSVTAHPANAAEPEQVQDFVRRADQLFERFWFFHGNAGVEGMHKSIADTSLEEWHAVLDVNLNSFFYGLKYVLPVFTRQGGGAVVLTGSLLSHRAAPNRADYTVPKHAVLGLARTAAAEVARHGVKVNCICPGPIETPLMTRSEHLINSEDPEEERRRFIEGTPIGRYGTPEEVAKSVAFLLSPDVPYLTGAALSLDGGLTAV